MSAGSYGVVVFGPLLADPHVRLLLAGCATAAERLRVVEGLRHSAAAKLSGAVARVPKASEHIEALYVAQGKPAPAWNLADDDDAVTFVLALPRHAPTPDEQRAAALLRACVLARELGDVAPFADLTAGARVRARAPVNARNPRPNTRDPLRASLLAALADERRRGRSLLEALQALGDVARGLRADSIPGAMAWRVSDDALPGVKPRPYKLKTLESLWTEAAKVKPARRRSGPSER